MGWLVLLVEPGVWPSPSSQVSFRLPHRGCRGASLQGPPNLYPTTTMALRLFIPPEPG